MELQFWEYPVYLVVQDKVQAEAVYDILENWNLISRMQFMSFNPTASNTGITAGCCIILEYKLNKVVLSLACRHHIMKLIVEIVLIIH